jgi:hypothetical protein
MDVTAIYETALKKLAEDGNVAAQMALVLAAKAATPEQETSHIKMELRNVNDHLSGAMRHNGRQWTASTDREIERAQAIILRIMGMLK